MSTKQIQDRASFGDTPAETAPAAPSTNGHKAAKPFTRSMMRDFKDRTVLPVELRDEDGEVYYINIRDLPASEAAELQNMFGDVATDESGKVKNTADAMRKMAGMIARSAVDDAGNLLFTEPQDMDWLLARPFRWLNKAFMVCMDVNALTGKGIEEQKKS